MDIVESSRDNIARDVTVNARDVAHGQQIVARVRALPEVRVLNVSDPTSLLHLRGKLEVQSKSPLKTRNDLSMAYTPGVARVCMATYDDPDAVWNLTIKGNAVAVVSDGTAVLGLGDIGPAAAMPMADDGREDNAFQGARRRGCLATRDTDERVDTVKRIEDLKCVLVGTGAGGIVTTKLLMEAGLRNIIGCDRTGVLHRGRIYGGPGAYGWICGWI